MSEPTPATLERLRLALHGVTAPFSCRGTYTREQPVTLVFKDGTRFEVIRARSEYEQEKTLEPLLRRCQPAPFGANKKTRYDRNVRDAHQLKAENGAFTVENFDPGAAGILEAIRRDLLPQDTNAISAELYTVNVYTSGGHFAPHKDTPRGGDMFGTLVVCLPSQFYHGQLVLSHRGVVEILDWATDIRHQPEANQLHWAAFFGDVEHQIKKVGGGGRVTLTYLLRRSSEAVPVAPAGVDLEPLVQDAWRALLADPSFLPKGGTLAYPCCHLYHQDARFQQEPLAVTAESAATLKGRDHRTATAALQVGLKVTFMPYMFENDTDGVWQLKRFPTSAERSRLLRQMDEDDMNRLLPIRAGSEEEGDFGVTWLEPPPSSGETLYRTEKDEESDLVAAAHLHFCEYCPWGNFGNEASEIDLYTYAALHFKIPAARKGIRNANARTQRVPAKRTPAKGTRAPRKPRPKE